MGCKQIARLITALCGAALFSACSFSDDFLTADDTQAAVASSPAYVKFGFLSPGTSEQTRSNPTGGEDGDGRENGQDYENAINSAVIILYQGDENDDKGINSDAETPVSAVFTYSGSSQLTSSTATGNYDNVVTTEPRETDLESGTYHVIAIANPSSNKWSWLFQTEENLTLGDVRDYIETAAWKETISGTNTEYSDFLMSSEADATIEVKPSTYDDPCKTSVDVERVAARVDYKVDNSLTVEDTNYPDATVEITGAALVNCLASGSYLIKRVNAGSGSDVTYLGDETETDGVSTNYVVDPWTASKTGDDVSLISGLAYNNYYPGEALDSQQDPSYWHALMSAGDAIGTDGFKRIGYTMENTTYAANTSKKYSTGVVFEAKFNPGESNVKGSYTDGATFFKWSGALYATAEDMMAAYSNRFATDHFASQIEACSSWSDVSTFANGLADEDPTGYKAYLLEQATDAEGDLTSTDKTNLLWDTYMKDVCGYTCSDGTVTLNSFSEGSEYSSTRAALADRTSGAVSTYEDGRCYYTWWIRHSNDASDTTNGVMEFSVVRNNIYKLTVKSVYTLGGDIPTEGIRVLDVKVNNWTLLNEETLDM